MYILINIELSDKFDKSDKFLPGKCQTPAIVYQATVTAEGSVKKYVGLTEPSFKKWFDNHKASFNEKT